MGKLIWVLTVLSGTLIATGCSSIKPLEAQQATSKQAIVGMVKPAGPYTPGVAAGGFVFLSGQVGRDASTNTLVPGGTKAETRQAMGISESCCRRLD